MSVTQPISVEVDLSEEACPECGEETLCKVPIQLQDGSYRQTVGCWACEWHGKPVSAPTGPEETVAYPEEEWESLKTSLVTWLRIGVSQVIVPAVVALPGLVLLNIPSWRQAGMVYLAFAYLFVYQVGTWEATR